MSGTRTDSRTLELLGFALVAEAMQILRDGGEDFLQQVRQLRQSGKEQQAEEVLRGLKALYGDDPSVRKALREAEGK